MPIASRTRAIGLIAACCLTGCAMSSARPPEDKPLEVTGIRINGKGRARLLVGVWRDFGRAVVVTRFKIDRNLVDLRRGHEVRIVRNFGDGGIMVIDSYGSRVGPLNRCQSGREVWVRTFSARQRSQTLAYMIESCNLDIDPVDEPVKWAQDGRSFTLEFYNRGGLKTSASYVLGERGAVVAR